jgi:putative spermidine/putrescine transport system substrate-binding protein
MKMLKRFIAVAIVLMMSVTVMAGCGGNTAGGSPAASAAADGGTAAAPQDKELVIVSWGGALNDAERTAYFKPFEEKFGVKINEVTPVDYAKLKAMVTSGNVEWDIVNADSDFVPRGIKEDLIQKLDFNVIDKTDLDPALITDYSVGAEMFAYAIAYNTEAYAAGSQPKSWKEFWDTTAFPGKRTLWKWPIGTLEIALLADGVKPEEMYPLDVDRALRSLDKIKSEVQVWWSTGSQPAQLLTDKEVVLGAAWNGRITSAQQQGAKIDVEFKESILLGDSYVVPKGAPHKDLAMQFIAFATRADTQAEFAKLIPYGPCNLKAFESLDDTTKSWLASSPDKRPDQLLIDVNWWAENFDSVNQKFNDWLLQ